MDAATNVDVLGGSVSINTAGGTTGQFAYANLPTPVTLNANTAYIILSQETSISDQWYDNNSDIHDHFGRGADGLGIRHRLAVLDRCGQHRQDVRAG